VSPTTTKSSLVLSLLAGHQGSCDELWSVSSLVDQFSRDVDCRLGAMTIMTPIRPIHADHGQALRNGHVGDKKTDSTAKSANYKTEENRESERDSIAFPVLYRTTYATTQRAALRYKSRTRIKVRQSCCVAVQDTRMFILQPHDPDAQGQSQPSSSLKTQKDADRRRCFKGASAPSPMQPVLAVCASL